MTRLIRHTVSTLLLSAVVLATLAGNRPLPANAQTPPDNLPVIAIYDASRTAPLNRVAPYRVRIYPKPGYAHHLGIRVGTNLSLNASCTTPERVDELILSLGWRPSPHSLFYPVSVWGCGVGGADSTRTLEARVWASDDNTPPSTFNNPAPDDFEAKPLTVQFIPDAVLPPEVSTPALTANKHLYLTSLTLYRTPDYHSASADHGRADLEITSVSPLQSVYPTGLYGRPDPRWRNNVQEAEVPMGTRAGGPLELDWWGHGVRVADMANPFDQLTYPFMALEHPLGSDGREWDFAGLRFHWRYELDVPQRRYSDVRSLLQEFLEGSLDLPRSMFLMPDWPAFNRPATGLVNGLPVMQDPDSHGNVILETKLLGGLCASEESVEIETLTVRPDRLTGEVVYTCKFPGDNPNGLTPIGVAGLHEHTLNGSVIHGFNRFVRGLPVVAYGHLTVQVSPDALPNWPATPVHSFALVPVNPASPLDALRAQFDVPLEPGAALAGAYPAHLVRMRLDVDHDLEVPYDKHVGTGYGLPTRRLHFRTIPQDTATEITSCSLQNTNVITNVITPLNPTPPPQFLPTIYQRSIRCWAEYEEITTISPTRWELLTNPNLTPPTFQPATVTAKSHFTTPDPFQIVTDHTVPSVALINSDIITYPDAVDITTARPTSLDRPNYPVPIITRHNANPVSLSLGDRAIEPLTIQGLDTTVNYDLVATYPTEAATDATCSTRTITDGLTTRSPDNVGAYAINLPIHACPTIGSGAASANITVAVRIGATTVASASVPLSVQRYPTPSLTLSVSNTNVAFGGSTDLSLTATGLNPAIEYSIPITVPTGLRFDPQCTVSSTTLNIQPFSLTHHDFVRAYGCGAGTGAIVATLQPVTPPGPVRDTDTNAATPQAQPTRTLYDPSLNHQVYFDDD